MNQTEHAEHFQTCSGHSASLQKEAHAPPTHSITRTKSVIFLKLQYRIHTHRLLKKHQTLL